MPIIPENVARPALFLPIVHIASTNLLLTSRSSSLWGSVYADFPHTEQQIANIDTQPLLLDLFSHSVRGEPQKENLPITLRRLRIWIR